MRVREAVRMSMSIPGWYLSMDKEDTFYKRLNRLKDGDRRLIRRVFYPEYRWERFESEGPQEFEKTLGVLIFSDTDREVYQDQFQERLDELAKKDASFRKSRPDTEKARKFAQQTLRQEAAKEAGIKSFEALVNNRMKTLIQRITGYDDTDGGTIDVPETQSLSGGAEGMPDGGEEAPLIAMAADPPPPIEPKITVEEARRKFFEIVTEDDVKAMQVTTKEEAFKELFLDVYGNLTVERVLNMYENYAPLQVAKRRILGTRCVESTGQFYGTLLDFVGSKNHLSEADIGRCIGVDVDYLSTMDFDMTPTDMEFLMAQGATAATAYIVEYVERKQPSHKV
ncbi:uncharacterized protein [Branchiostoma lanceolatum]|uniref:uncharacterized protein isoform X2 n=1 Tax=Branchiostoma lanceolatum TaxID=7740 RepID=UPI0034544CA8